MYNVMMSFINVDRDHLKTEYRFNLMFSHSASDLPGDRLSQVTRRGMLSDLRTRQGTKTVHQSMEFLNVFL